MGFLERFFFLSIFLFADLSLEHGLNSKLFLHQDFWSLTILLEGWAGNTYGEPFVAPPSPTPPLHCMVHRSIVCPINNCGVHMYFTISMFLKYTCIFTQQAHGVDATSHRRQFDIGTTSCACWVPIHCHPT